MFNVDVYRPPFDLVLIGAFLAVLALAVVVLYGRRHRSPVKLLLRLAAIGAIAWVLAGPSVLDHSETAGRVEVVMLTDTSASMAETDAGETGDTSRLNALRATWLDPAFLERVRASADLRLIAFDESPRIVAEPDLAQQPVDGSQTRLFEALASTLGESAGSPLTVLLSDGHDTRTVVDSSVIAQLQRAARPVYAVPVGQTLEVVDLAVQAWADADFLFEQQTTTINATVIQNGFDHTAVRVELLESGRLIDQQTVDFTDEAARSVRFEVAPRTDPSSPGSVTLVDYRVRVVPIQAQRTQSVLENDEQFVFVQVSRDRVKVALFEGEPYWDTRYLAQVLRADQQAELAAIYRFGPDRQVRVVSGQTAGDDESLLIDPSRITQEQLNQFDVVVLGKHAERMFPGQRASLLVDFVKQRGGAVVMARGRAFANDRIAQEIVEEIEPVTWGERAVDSLKLKLTPEGASSPLLRFDSVAPTDVILTELPGVLAATQIEREKAATMILLRQTPTDSAAPSMAAVAHQRVGRGQVLAVLGDGLWRWALLPTEKTPYDPVYQMFWTRAVRWLATGGEFLPGQNVSMKLDRLTVEPKQPVTITLTTRHVEAGEFEPVLRLISPDGAVQVVEPKQVAEKSDDYTAVIEPQAAGVWRVELTDASADPLIDPASPITSRLAVYDASRERLDPSARPRVLKQLTDATGGACWALDEPDELLKQIDRIAIARESDVTARYDFNRGWVFAIITLALAGEWVLRRRSGLL